MAYFQVTYVVWAADITEVMGRIAFPDGEPNTDELKSVLVQEVEWRDE